MPAFAQFDESSDTELEQLYDKFEDQDVERTAKKKKRVSEAKAKRLEREYTKLSDLGTLAPFNDIAVIQRRFLPKTERFELSGSAVFNTNNQFFNILGLGLRGSYFFTEKYGFEVSYLFLNSSERDVTSNLQDSPNNIKTDSLVEPDSYFGAAFRWTPVYGKIAWFEKKIIPFDFFFTPGFGMTKTVFGGSESTFSLGMGQQFALSKSSAVRWDFVWNFYSAETEVDGVRETKNNNDLMLMIGYSFFFPEAKYR